MTKLRLRFNGGSTYKALAYAEERLHRLGRVHEVKAYRLTTTQTDRWQESGKRASSSVRTDREYILIKGEYGTMRLTGLCWGYSGEGPRGLHRLLMLCGMDDAAAQRWAFKTERLDDDGLAWVAPVRHKSAA